MWMFFMLPFVFLSASSFRSAVPKIFQWISMIVPARHFVEVNRGIVLRGTRLTDLWQATALLTLSAAATSPAGRGRRA